MTPLDRLHHAIGAPAVIARRAVFLYDQIGGSLEDLATRPDRARLLGERAARAVVRADDRACVADLSGAAACVLGIWSWRLADVDDREAVQAIRYARREVAASHLRQRDPANAVAVEHVVQTAVRSLEFKRMRDLVTGEDPAGRIGEYSARLAVGSADKLRVRLAMSHLHAASVEIAHAAGDAAADVHCFPGFDLANAVRLDRAAMKTLQVLLA